MKRIISLILTLFLMMSLVACSGNFTQVDLKEPITIPKNGIIEKSIFDQIKTDHAIAVFTGESNDIKYEWKIFGKELGKTRDINLSVGLEKTTKGIKVRLSEAEDFGFSALLSICINEKWDADTATAYSDNAEVYSVSLTGTDTTILNVSINTIYSVFEIMPDKKVYEDSETAINATTDSTSSEKDKYQTDPIPEGNPNPVEPDNAEINNKKTYTCTFSIECSTILNNLSNLDPNKLELIPVGGVILAPTKVTFYEGESVFDVLQRVCKDKGIHLESSWTPMYNSAYIEGIYNLYEFDCGSLSGWMYRVNGWYPNYGCSRYQLKDGDVVEWRYTCDLGKDVGEEWMGQ